LPYDAATRALKETARKMSSTSFVPHKDRLLPLDGIRGYAVLMVFFVHYTGQLAGYLGIALSPPSYGSPSLFLTWLVNSNYGVYLFFI
jgi:peptidoglycan/LPS O-acetylase OafA/YrhL